MPDTRCALRGPGNPAHCGSITLHRSSRTEQKWLGSWSHAGPRVHREGPGDPQHWQNEPHRLYCGSFASPLGDLATGSRREKERVPRSHPSSRQGSAQWLRADPVPTTAWLQDPGAGPRAGYRHAWRGGAGVQPRGPARDRAQVPEARLVQNSAPEADHPRGGLQQPHHHQPLLLWPVQFLLHPQTHQEGGRFLSVLLLLQTQEIHHHDGHAQLSWATATHQEETGHTREAVSLHIHRFGLSQSRIIQPVIAMPRATPKPPDSYLA